MHPKLKNITSSGFSFIELLMVVVLVSMAFVIFLGALSSNKQVDAQVKVKTIQAIMLNDIQEQIRARRYDQSEDGSWSSSLGPDQGSGYELDFSGGNHEVKITGSNFISGNEARSISVWANGSSGNIVSLGHGWTSNQRFSILIGGSRVYIIGQWNDWATNYYLPSNQSTHLVVTHDGSTIKLYANGVFQQQTSKSYNTNASMPIMIGTNCDDRNDEYFNGTIDDVIITRDVLTAQEIISIYNGESVDLDNVVGQYDFNEGSGSVLTDLSSNGNNGTIYGATWRSNSGGTIENDISDFNDIDDFDGYQAENIENFPGFSLSVEVDYVNLSSKFRLISSSPTNYKRVITSVNHDAIDQISDTLIISAGIQ